MYGEAKQMSEQLTVQITKTANEAQEYLQILSKDGWSLNIVLIADVIEVRDERNK